MLVALELRHGHAAPDELDIIYHDVVLDALELSDGYVEFDVLQLLSVNGPLLASAPGC